MKLYIGADHQGYNLKKDLVRQLSANYEVVDVIGDALDPEDDYPIVAARVVNKLLADHNKDSRAILICGSGQGVAMAANRFKGIRAALCWNETEARLARNDDDSNVLCLSSQASSSSEAISIAETWLKTPFAAAGRFLRRIKELDRLP